jgi:hypothetical protein
VGAGGRAHDDFVDIDLRRLADGERNGVGDRRCGYGKCPVVSHGVTGLRVGDRFGEFGFGDARGDDADPDVAGLFFTNPSEMAQTANLVAQYTAAVGSTSWAPMEARLTM